MATLLSGLRIPIEILSLTLSYLDDTGPKFDIFCASLVCRAWYDVAFPIKFRRINLDNVRHLNDFTTRLELESHKDPLRLGSCLRALCVDIHSDDPHTQLEPFLSILSRFRLVIERLVNLEELCWYYYFEEVSVTIDFFETFRGSCRKLRDVLIYIPEPDTSETLNAVELSRKALVFRLQDKLSVSWHQGPETLLQAPSPLIEMIENSPNLSSLELDLSGSLRGWCPAPILRGIKNPLQELVHLSLGGHLEGEWYNYLDESVHAPTSLYGFFERHPKLRGLYIFAVDTPPVGFTFHPGLLERLFPALSEFHGPFEMCVSIATSQLAEQLESLFILPTCEENEISMHPLEKLSRVTRPLPRLLELGFLDSGHPALCSWTLNAEDLEKLFFLTPRLKYLDFGISNTYLVNLLQPLRCIPNLIEISIPDPKPESLVVLMLFKFCLIQLINTHPRLDSIVLQSGTSVIRTLYIRRLFDESGSVSSYHMY